MMRNCPICHKEIQYKSKSYYNNALKNNRSCKQCINIKRNESIKYNGTLEKVCINCKTIVTFKLYKYYKLSKPVLEYLCKKCASSKTHKGKIISDIHKEKLRKFHTGKKASDITRKKISDRFRGEKNPCFGRSGSKNPMYGKSGILSPTYGKPSWCKGMKNPFSPEVIKKMKLAKIGKWKGPTNPNFGNHNPLSEEHKRKLRLSHIERISKIKFAGGQMKPAFNIDACKLIDEYGKRHSYKFQHALNGGEYHIKELGYWVDGYDKEKNTVIEFFEFNKHHYDEFGNIQLKDINRLTEIKNYLKCDIILLEECKLENF